MGEPHESRPVHEPQEPSIPEEQPAPFVVPHTPGVVLDESSVLEVVPEEEAQVRLAFCTPNTATRNRSKVSQTAR